MPPSPRGHAKAGMITALFRYFRDDILLANVTPGDVLDRDPGFRRDGARPFPHAVTQR